nr:hypothetical protein [Halococcus sp. PRR34]
MSALHIADTGFFVAFGRPSKQRYQRVRTFAKRNEIVFVISERIYEGLTGTEASDVDERKQFRSISPSTMDRGVSLIR